MSESTNPATGTCAAKLWGTWLLNSYSRIVDGEVISLPLGDEPAGQLTYQPDGRMSALLMRSGRAWPDHQTFLAVGDRERGAAAVDFAGYGGAYDVTGSTVTHHVEMSLYPDHVGTDLVRSISWVDDCLVLCTIEGRTRSGRPFHDRIEWRPA